jgi:hypothetical protein
MDMRSILQIPKNLLANMTFKLGGKEILPSIEITGRGLLDLHADNIWVVSLVGEGFLKRRILWEDFKHEFRFVDPAKRGSVCRDALLEAASAMKQAQGETTGKSSTQLVIIDLLVAARAIVEVAAKDLIVNRDDYNKWVLSTGGDASEKMSEDEHLASLIGSVSSVRLKIYPLWSSLISLLPDGATKKQAEEKLLNGCRTVGIDTSEIAPDWQIVNSQ